jgi:hypothetical protein
MGLMKKAHYDLKLHKHEIYLILFAKTESLWSQGPVTRDMLSQRLNHFLVCSVCDEIVSTYAQHAQAMIFENYSKIPN